MIHGPCGKDLNDKSPWRMYQIPPKRIRSWDCHEQQRVPYVSQKSWTNKSIKAEQQDLSGGQQMGCPLQSIPMFEIQRAHQRRVLRIHQKH
jgi:hypothetical protein